MRVRRVRYLLRRLREELAFLPEREWPLVIAQGEGGPGWQPRPEVERHCALHGYLLRPLTG